jgi:hypothetical protein
LVTLRREGEDFAVAFYPQDIIAFRNKDPQKLRKMCSFLRWKIISDAALDEEKAGLTKHHIPIKLQRSSHT